MTCEPVAPGRTVVLSSVASDAHTWNLVYLLITRLRADPELAALPVVIGGKLGVDGADMGQAAELVAGRVHRRPLRPRRRDGVVAGTGRPIGAAGRPG